MLCGSKFVVWVGNKMFDEFMASTLEYNLKQNVMAPGVYESVYLCLVGGSRWVINSAKNLAMHLR